MDDRNNQACVENAEVEQTKKQNMPEAHAEADNQNEAEKGAGSFQPGDGGSLYDQAIDTMCEEIGQLVHYKKADETKENVRNVLATVCAMSSQDEFAVGIRVKGEMWRFSDYTAPDGIGKLLAPKRVVVSDVSSARDFLDRGKFKAKGRVLNPSDFESAIRFVQKQLRVNSELKPLSRSDLTLLEAATKVAVRGGKVVNRTQDQILFLTTWFDDEARVNIRDWAKDKAAKLFS